MLRQTTIQPNDFFSDNSYALSNNQISVSETISTADSTASFSTTASLKISQLPPEIVIIRKLLIEEILMQTDPFALYIVSFLGL